MKRFRPFLLIFILILAFSCTIVNSLAVDDSNLIDSNMSNWVDLGDSNSSFNSADISFLGGYSNYISVGGSSKIVILYDVSEFLKVGESYRFTFTLPTTDGVNNSALNNCQIGFLLANNNNGPVASDTVFEILINSSNKVNYVGKTTTYEFSYTQGYANTCIALYIFPNDDASSYPYLQFYINNIKLERIESEEEKKLDGILEWLQELWDSIVNGFSNLGDTLINGLNDLSNSIRETFSDFASTIVNYILYFQDEPIEENPFIADDDSISYMSDKIQSIVDYINESAFNITSLLDSLSGGVYLFTEFVEDNGWLLALCVFGLTLLVFTRFIGI